jgi:hypothetical protein
MKYKKYIWIFFILAITIGITYFLQRSHNIEGFMTEDEFVTEANHRIKTIQTIKASINDSLNAFDKSAKDTCDLTPKYRDAFVSATAELPKYNSLTNDERQKSARAEYDDQRLNFIASGNPIYECFATQDEVDTATKKLKAEMKELSDLLASPRLRIMIQKGTLLTGLQNLNSIYSGSRMVFEAFVVNEDLLESADTLIKKAREIQTVTRTALVNASILTRDIVKIPEFVKNRLVSKETTLIKEEVPLLFTGRFKVAVINYYEKFLNEQLWVTPYNTTIVDKFTINSKNKESIEAALTFPKYRVIVYHGSRGNSINLTNYLESGGNLVCMNIWDESSKIEIDYDKYLSFGKTGVNKVISDTTFIQKNKEQIIDNSIYNKDNLIYKENLKDRMSIFGNLKVKNNSELLASISCRNDQTFERIEEQVLAVKNIGNSRTVSFAYFGDYYYEFVHNIIARSVLWAARIF